MIIINYSLCLIANIVNNDNGSKKVMSDIYNISINCQLTQFNLINSVILKIKKWTQI